ncbi:hypothetical protein CQ393_09325 [Stenotrophomonas sp. MYb238]|uniref:hypothetical protein n=1 Tax=Stenotrophomonas sp. MYb238 TaxID=2040281 RepID=UPI0012927C0C|nr:hypothetical protein [Stenotrophomonas sp. MYb238]MQP76091.1 hypothetical protein [Stenotrophomonas sp. MYb238]
MSHARRHASGPAAPLLSLALLPARACARERCHRRDTDRFEILSGCWQTAPGTLAIGAGALARLRLDEKTAGRPFFTAKPPEG